MIMAYLCHSVHKKFKITFFSKRQLLKFTFLQYIAVKIKFFIIDLLVTDGLNSKFLKGHCSKQTLPKLCEIRSYSIFMACVYLIIYLLPFQPFLLLIITISLYYFRLILSSGINANIPTFVDYDLASLPFHFDSSKIPSKEVQDGSTYFRKGGK